MSGSSDAAHDADTSSGVADEVASGAGSPGAGTIDDEGTAHADLDGGVLSPGSTATGDPTEPS